jgi:single-strand DNA-binding protein
MFETPITVVGRIVTDPRRRTVGDQDVVKFRMASNTRRRTDDGNWEPGDSLFVNVNCWGRLVTGVAGTLKKGDAVIAVGNVHTNEYDDREGVRRSSLELRAIAVGPDLARYIAKLEKHGHAQPAVATEEEAADPAATAIEAEAEGGGLPLSA